MPQETNLNVAPYFDDYDVNSNYYKVLFKPAYPVQARELNNLQSMLQNQIEDFGNHIFKEGAKVIPGQLTYNKNYYAIQVDSEFLGIPVSIYADQLIGKYIKGETSGVTAKIVNYLNEEQSERGVFTFYLEYKESSTTDLATQTFSDNEVLLTQSDISFATTFISAGEGFAKAISINANAIGSSFALENGVYFIRGYFVDVYKQLLILDQYSNTPSYRIGFLVKEETISSDVDPTLTDNAQGFNNYTAPGADRLKITATLTKRSLDQVEDSTSFIELAEVQNGFLRKIASNTEYNYLGDELARRTFDESGHYYVRAFNTTVKDSLNNGFGNRGIYNPTQLTPGGNTPSDDLALYKLSPGKAYVRGYEIDVKGPTFLECPKPRTTRTLESQGINFAFGPTFTVNNSTGAPTLGFDTTNIISLRDSRVGTDPLVASGKEIGIARFYDFVLESGAYDATLPALNQWDLTLFDIQNYSEFTVNENTTLTVPTFIRGKQSGASAFLRYDVSAGTAFTAYDVKGEFFPGERIVFNGDDTDGRTVTDYTEYEISDIKSAFSSVGVATFSADLILTPRTTIGIASITSTSGGVSTVTTPGGGFPGIVTAGNIIQYSIATNSVPSFANVRTVNTNSLIIEPVETVTGYRIGSLPTSTTEVTDLSVVEAGFQRQSTGANFASNQTLYSVFPKKNISSVDLNSASLSIRRSFSVDINSGSTTPVSSGVNEFFLAFDEERYTLIRSDGTTEVITSDKFAFTNGNQTLTINGLTGSNDTGATLTTTLRKSKITAKKKINNISQSVVINKSASRASGVGGTTLNDGLTYGNFPYGTRIQDDIISLNVPDIITIYGVFESTGTTEPFAPSMTTASLDGPTSTTNDLILGDEIYGTISGARAILIARKNDTSVYYIYKNKTPFQRGEVINFIDSGVSAISTDITSNGNNITKNFKFSNGQTGTFYDVSRLIRTTDAPIPKKQLKVYYQSASYNSADDGDITLTNSYSDFNFSNGIPTFNRQRISDFVDARPRVSTYNVAPNLRSPLEFYGRSFNGGQHSSRDVIASDENMTVSYDYFLGRIDSIYLTKEGVFNVKYGAPDDNPKPPEGVPGAINVANIYLPPYTFNVNNAKVTQQKYRRYQMSDISKLDQRVKNLEYYTSLSQLETNTLNQFVPDANGLNRFKSGIFVDNFTSVETQDPTVGIRNSVDRKRKILRPSHYTTSFNTVIGNTTIAGIGTTTASNQDSRFADVMGNNISRTNQVITLDYTEQSWLSQDFATRVESVTPYLVTFYSGSIKFDPTVDVWIDVTQLEVNDVVQEGSFNAMADMVQAEVTEDADGGRTGVSPIQWESWETNGVNVDVDMSSSQSTSTSTSSRQGTQQDADNLGLDRWDPAGGVPGTFTVEEQTSSTTTTVSTSVTVGLDQSRRGTQYTVNEVIDTESLGDRVVDREVINFMRSRNIEITAQRMKPFTQVYSFFDNVDVNNFVFSKLVEIEMTSGTFQVGETVTGSLPGDQEAEDEVESTSANITFRVSNPNHKFGPYNAPTDVFDNSPYNRDIVIPPVYSETSTLINIDTFSLASEESPQYAGWIAPGMILVGEDSGAQATITNVRLVTDAVGTLICNYLVPPSGNPENPTFETGQNKFRLTSSETDSRIEGTFSTSAEEIFYSQGDMDFHQEVTLSLRNAEVVVDDSFVENRTISGSDTASTSFETDSSTELTGGYTDPLAQSFFVDDPTGIFLTSVDIFFFEVPQIDRTPVFVQIREVELGTPNDKILAFSNINVDPRTITTSPDATVATNVKFDAPVYLEGQREYALIIGSSNTEYSVWISRLGEPDVTTLAQESGQVIVSSQTLLGSLFKSQNASTWTPSQYEDLKFQLYRANFSSQGSVQFFNPNLPSSLELMKKDPITMPSRNIKVGLGTTVQDAGLVDGNTVIQLNTNATGNFIGYGGSAYSDLGIINAGVGYTPSSSYYTFTGVALTSVTGTGLNATADITISNGIAIGATIRDGGNGYKVGDILSPITIGAGVGVGARLSVSTLYGNNELFISDVQGEFSTNSSDTLTYTNSVGLTTALNYSVGGSVSPQTIRVDSDGQHMTVFMRNHGMHNLGNQVTLKGLRGEVATTQLSADYSNTATGSIPVYNSTGYTSFEGVGVGLTNPGYVKIGDEIISYTGTTSTQLTGVTRGVDNTVISSHLQNFVVHKYEMNGVSLRRINRTHQLNEVTNSESITLDTFPVKIDMSENGTDRTGTGSLPKLFFASSLTGGGHRGKSTYNVPFEQIVPNFNTIEPSGTTIEASVRTTSGTSVSGSEPSFQDKGFQAVTLNQNNYFDSPRIVASKVNEDAYLDELPGNKSFTVNMVLNSSDNRITPAIDLDQTAVVFTSNRINQPVTNYTEDFRVNTTAEDPNRCFYVTKEIILENPATSIQVICDAYLNEDADIRAFYSFDQNTQANETIFTPFPGFANQDNVNRPGIPVDSSLNDGTPDLNVPKTDTFLQMPTPAQFSEYKFTINKLPSFNSFRVKLILTTTNQAFVPQVKNLRVTALA